MLPRRREPNIAFNSSKGGPVHFVAVCSSDYGHVADRDKISNVGVLLRIHRICGNIVNAAADDMLDEEFCEAVSSLLYSFMNSIRQHDY